MMQRTGLLPLYDKEDEENIQMMKALGLDPKLYPQNREYLRKNFPKSKDD